MDNSPLPGGSHTLDNRLPVRLLAWVDGHRRWLFAGLLLLYAAGFNGQWRLGPDTAIYATIGRQLAEGQGYTYPGGGETHDSPGLPALLALSFRLFGPETFWPACLLMWLLGLAALALVYRLFLLSAGRPTAVLVTCLVGVARFVYVYAFELLTDMPFFVGLLLLLVGLESLEQRRGRWWTNGLMMALGIAAMAAFRVVVLNVLVALGGVVLWRIARGPNRMGHLAIGILAVICLIGIRAIDPRLNRRLPQVSKEQQAIAALANPRQTLRSMVQVHLPLLLNHVGPQGFFGCELAPGVNALATVTVLGLGIGLVRRRLLWGLLVVVFALQWLLFLPAPRYFLPVLPLLMFGWWRGTCWCERRLPPPWGRRAFVFLLLLVTATNLVRTGKIIVWEQRWVPFLPHYKAGLFDGVPEFGRVIRAKTGPNALIILGDTKAFPVFVYYGGRRVVQPRDLAGGNDGSGDVIRARLAGETEFYVVLPGGEDLRRLRESVPLRLKKPLVTVPRHGGTMWELRRAHLGTAPAHPPTPLPGIGAPHPAETARDQD